MEDSKNKGSQDLSFSFDEILVKLEEMKAEQVKPKFTAEQDQVILKAREGENVLSWKKLRKLFKEVGWGDRNESTFSRRYSELKEATSK